MRAVYAGVFLTLLAAGCGGQEKAAEVADAPELRSPEIVALNAKFDPARDPVADLRIAMAEARRSGRHVVLDVGGEWCIWCHRMDAFIARDPGLSRLRDDNYVWMKVNYDEDQDNAAFLSRYPEITGYPHLLVLDADGTLLHSQNTGDLEQGESYDPAKFAGFLRQWMPKKS